MRYKPAILLALLIATNIAFALPTGGEVVAGIANITQNGANTTIDQTTNSAVINWKNFDTASNEAVNFHQPNANSTTLNRITSGLPTNFAGSLFANGKVFVVNPAGMVFAGATKINATCFIATTADIQNNDFMKGNYYFKFNPNSEKAQIINNGTITVTGDAGVIYLIAPNVSNGKTGVIDAKMGQVFLASAPSGAMTIDFNSDEIIHWDISNVIGKYSRTIENAGAIRGGIVFLEMVPVSEVLNNVISMSGTIEAQGVVKNKQGIVMLSGLHTDTTISGSIQNKTGWTGITSSSVTEADSGKIDSRYLYTESMPGKTKLNNNNAVYKFEHDEDLTH